MNDNLALIETAPAQVLPELDRLFSGLEREGGFARAAGSNFFIVSGARGAGTVSGYIDIISLLRPGRLFVLAPSVEAHSIRTRIAALCRPLSRTEHVCCELIEIAFKPALWPAVPSLLGSLMRSGDECELFLADAAVVKGALEYVAPLAERIIFDSGDFGPAIFSGEDALARLLLAENHQLVDLKWLSFGLWREQLRFAFDKPAVQRALPFLSRIEVIMHGPQKSGIPSVGLLAAGWLASRLGLEIDGFTGGLYQGRAPGGRRVSLALRSSCAVCAEALDELNIYFARDGSSSAGQECYVSIRQGRVLETVVQIGEAFRVSNAFESSATADLLKKYFTVGDSTLNYRAAVEAAFKLSGFEP